MSIDPRFDYRLWQLVTPILHELWVHLRERLPEICEHPLDLITLLEDGDLFVGNPEMEWNTGYLIGFADAVQMTPSEVIEEWVGMMERISFGREWWKSQMP
tara:strand:+ start:426 stop:728 length:303 start_codon:yes stop_codon:yes gene_type:complete